MKKLKLFSKTYIFTVGLISLIIFTSNILIYLAVPRVYLSNKEKEADIIISELTQKINEETSEKSFELAKGFAQKYNIQVFITLGEEQRSFQGVENVDIYIDKDVIKDKSLILPDLTGEGIVKSSEEEEVDSINEGIFSQYINVNNSSIIKSRDFKTINDVKGNIQIVTNLESFTETRDIILKILPYSMIVSLIVALIASYIYAKKITTPIKEICNVTKEMEKLNKRAFCNVESEDEIGILAYNINSLYENLLNTIISLEEEIKKMCIEENLFGAAKEYRAKRIYGYIWNRAKRLDKTLIDLFCTSDLATQKVINLIAILRSDRLFFEFMFEVYREKNILGIPIIEDADVNIFFKNKEIQSEDIAAWTDGTKRRLRSIYFNYLTDANLLTVVEKKKTITPPILDIALERYLEACGESVIIKAITGVD